MTEVYCVWKYNPATGFDLLAVFDDELTLTDSINDRYNTTAARIDHGGKVVSDRGHLARVKVIKMEMNEWNNGY
jgi:hypothetical protein